MDSDGKPGFIERLTALLLRKPEDREELLEILHAAYDRNLMDADALTIIEGALAASDTRVTDVMIPRAMMDVIDIDDPMNEIIPVVIKCTCQEDSGTDRSGKAASCRQAALCSGSVAR